MLARCKTASSDTGGVDYLKQTVLANRPGPISKPFVRYELGILV